MTVGLKYDEGKPCYWRAFLNFSDAIAGASTAADYGWEKYCKDTGLPDDNWKYVPEFEKRYFSAMLRHWRAIKKGEVEYQENGRTLNHWHSFAWNALALSQLGLEKMKEYQPSKIWVGPSSTVTAEEAKELASTTDFTKVRNKTEEELEADIASDPDWADQPKDWYKDAQLIVPEKKEE